MTTVDRTAARAEAMSPPPSAAKAAFEAAVEAVKAQHAEEIRRYLQGDQPANQWRPEAFAVVAVAAYLDSLLGGLPEEAHAAALGQLEALAVADFSDAERVELIIEAFLRSLHGTLAPVQATADPATATPSGGAEGEANSPNHVAGPCMSTEEKKADG